MLYREIIAVCSLIHTKHINTLCGQNVEFVNVKPGGLSRDSSVGVATRYGLDGPGIESRWGSRISAPVQTSSGSHPVPYTMGTGSFPGVKRPGRFFDHPPDLAPR